MNKNTNYPVLADDGVVELESSVAREIAKNEHYLHRPPQVKRAFGLVKDGYIVGIITYGTPASRHLQIGASPDDPSLVIELNRMWVSDEMPRNTESKFISSTLKKLGRYIVVSYADTSVGHTGTVYRAANFHYAGWTDMDRKTPRYDYIPVNGGHSRNATRENGGGVALKVRRKPKVKYWTVAGSKTDKKALNSKMKWPILDYSESPPPTSVNRDVAA